MLWKYCFSRNEVTRITFARVLSNLVSAIVIATLPEQQKYLTKILRLDNYLSGKIFLL